MPGLHLKKKSPSIGLIVLTAGGILLVLGVILLLWAPWATPEAAEASSTPEPVTPFGSTLPDQLAGRHSIDLPSYDVGLLTLGTDGRIQYGGDAQVGIDVSAWQYDIDWESVAADGVDFAIIRVGYRGYTEGSIYEDEYFTQNMDGALAAGLDVGVYFYSQALTAEEALEEAEFTISQLEGYEVACPVVFDWEIVGGEDARTYWAGRGALQECADAFCSAVEDAGYEPMIYFTQYLGLQKYQLRDLTEYGFWYAEYTETPHFPYDFDMWQYTCTGIVDGITEEVDINIWFTPES